MKIWKNCVLFYAGGACYLTLELLFRGRSHGSMFLAGGVCFLMIGHLDHVKPRLGPVGRTVLGALIITAVELAAGMLVNRDHGVWDYRDQPLNFMGQVCPVFTMLWLPVSLAAGILYRQMEGLLEKRKTPETDPGS